MMIWWYDDMMIIIDILEPPAFQKYSTCWVFKHFVFVFLCILHLIHGNVIFETDAHVFILIWVANNCWVVNISQSYHFGGCWSRHQDRLFVLLNSWSLNDLKHPGVREPGNNSHHPCIFNNQNHSRILILRLWQ